MKKLIALALCLTAFAVTGSSQVITWNFTDLNATFDTGTPVNWTVSDITAVNVNGTVATPVNATSASSGYTGASGGGNFATSPVAGALNSASSTYLTFTLTPLAGYELTISNLDFGVRATGTGGSSYSLRSSIDSYASDIFTGSIALDSTWAYKDNAVFAAVGPAETPVTFRLYAYGGSGSASTQNTRFDDFTLTAVANAIPEPTGAMLAGAAGLGVILMRRRRK